MIMEKILRAGIGVFVLSFVCVGNVCPSSLCYQCILIKVNGEFLKEGEGNDIHCKDSPELGFSGPCKGECITMEFMQTVSFFGQTETQYQFARGCTEYFTDPSITEMPATYMPKPGTCIKDDEFEEWFFKTFLPPPTESPHPPPPFGSPPPFGGPKGTNNPPLFGTPPPFGGPSGTDNQFGTLPPGGLGDLFNFDIKIEGSVCQCSSNYCKDDVGGSGSGSNILIPGRIFVATGVILVSIFGNLLLTS